MPKAGHTTLSNDVRDATLDLLWRQWRAVGASAATTARANAIVDPEALLFMSLWIVEHELRLADLAASWVTMNAPLLSVQRMQNMRDGFPPIVAKRLSAIADIALTEAKDARWKSLREEPSADLGLRMNKIRAIEARFGSWATLLLQLRRGVGVGAKADVLAFVLAANAGSQEWASVATIAEATGYTPASVRRVAEDLAAARFIRSLDTVESQRNAQRMYSAQIGDWKTLLGIGTTQPGWPHWRERFAFVIDVLDWLDGIEKRPIGAYARDVGAREILERHQLTLFRDRVADRLQFATADLNMAYLETVSRALCQWMKNYG